MKVVKAGINHFDDYFILRCDENNVFWSGHKNAPTYEKLKEWYEKNIQREDRAFFLCYREDALKEILGYLYLDKLAVKENKVVDIGYGVHKDFNGKGFGTKIIQFAIDYVRKNILEAEVIEAWVAHNNMGSIKVFMKNDFSKTEETTIKTFESNNEKVLFEKYCYYLNA